MQPAFAKHPRTLATPIALIVGTAAMAWLLHAAYVEDQLTAPGAPVAGDIVPFVLLLVGGLLLYFLPSFIGIKKRNAGAIFALNLLLGWTLLGWVVALVWALTKDPVDPFAQRQAMARLTEQPGPGDVQPSGTAQPERLG